MRPTPVELSFRSANPTVADIFWASCGSQLVIESSPQRLACNEVVAICTPLPKTANHETANQVGRLKRVSQPGRAAHP